MRNFRFVQTEVSDPPLALCSFQGMLLAGVGKVLRLYELGKRKLLRKSENRVCAHKAKLVKRQNKKQFPSAIRKVQSSESRIFVSSMASGAFVVAYSAADRAMKIVADNVTKFYTTAATLLDHDTIAQGFSRCFSLFAFSRFGRNKTLAEMALLYLHVARKFGQISDLAKWAFCLRQNPAFCRYFAISRKSAERP